MLNYDLFKVVVAPEFAGKSNSTLDLFAAQAEIQITEKVWLTRYDMGVAYLTAHMITMADRNARSGGNKVTGELRKTKVGNLEREYAVDDKNSDGAYNLTSYGKEFIRLRKQLVIGPIFLGC